jgi:hypothetical protein
MTPEIITPSHETTFSDYAPSAKLIEQDGKIRMVFQGFHNAHIIPDNLVEIKILESRIGGPRKFAVSILGGFETEVLNSRKKAELRAVRMLLSAIGFLAESLEDSFEEMLEEANYE